MAVTRTIIRVPSQDVQYSVNGDYTAATIQNMYAAQIPGISNMTASSVEEDGPNGRERIVTFTVRAGNKG